MNNTDKIKEELKKIACYKKLSAMEVDDLLFFISAIVSKRQDKIVEGVENKRLRPDKENPTPLDMGEISFNLALDNIVSLIKGDKDD